MTPIDPELPKHGDIRWDQKLNPALRQIIGAVNENEEFAEQKGQPDGLAELDENGQVPEAQLPASYPAWFSGSNPFDEGILAIVKPGDMFVYDSSGPNPGWLYQWRDNDWQFVIDFSLAI